MPHWQYLEENPEKARIFHDAMERGALPLIKKMISHCDFSSCKKIVDVGGGKGQLLCEILTQYENASGIVLDLPNAETSANEYIASKQLLTQAN